jgi:hypothetical protein
MTMFDRSLNGTQSKNTNHHVHVRDATCTSLTSPFLLQCHLRHLLLMRLLPPYLPIHLLLSNQFQSQWTYLLNHIPPRRKFPPLPTGAEPETSRTYQLGPATHADSNSATFVQPVKKLSKLSDTQKASQKLRRQIAQEAHEKLIKEFNVLIERHSNEQADLVKRHDVKPEYLDKLKGTSKHFNAKREANLENTKLHKKSLEVNAGMYLHALHQIYLTFGFRSCRW